MFDLDGVELSYPVVMLNVRFQDRIRLTDASLPALTLVKCHLPGLEATQLTVRGDLKLTNATMPGGVLRLQGAHIKGDLHLNGARLQAIQLSSAKIGGRLDLRRARLCNKEGTALEADGLTVGHHLKGSKLHAEGEVWLRGARIDGNLELQGATLVNPRGFALGTDHLAVQQDVFLTHGFRARGEVRLRGAKIDGTLEMDGARFDPSGHGGVHLEQLQVHKLDMRDLARPPERLYLLNSKLSILTDDPRSWPRSLYLRDCTYDSLVEEPRIEARQRLQWLQRDSFGYQPQPYEQLAAVYRRAGRHQDARTVAIASQRARRRTLPLPGRLANVLLDALVGYGYRTWLAGAWLLGLVLAGWVAFDLAHPVHLVAPLPPGERPLFHAGLYALDLLLPVGDLDYQGAWIARGWARGLWLGWILAGWVLTTAVLAALASILKRD